VQFFRGRHEVSELAEIHIIRSSYQLGPKDILDVNSERYQPARVMMIEAR
jgi:tRNA1(Val) A37 N6-methylase TrmN6